MKIWLMALLALPFTLFAEERVVSVGGDITEIIYALDAQQSLVARDSTSLHPAVVTKLPDVGYMRQLNAEGILAMKPTLVIASVLAKPSVVLKQVEQANVKVVTVTGEPSLNAIQQKITTIASALHRETQGEALVAKINSQLKGVAGKPLPVKVLYILNHSGMKAMAAGTQTAADGAIHSAGLQNAMGNIPHYQTLTQEGIVASAPQLVVIGESGLKSMGGEEKIWQLPGLALTPAGKNHSLLVVDEMSLLGFGLQTPRAIAKLRKAAEALAQ
ncbi:hemin ABC transporter substrate-binding protein [Erwinia tracheiphila]|uniref:Hemin ABC transporter substrate-binding protein n=1 Tax=Erwinia tracheiphila TaxID=65700 RepID=A0A0M2KJR3_9GAMM|nr:hemin ABC transporter substrate-binding protein [Erwinia tracheiphila]AXF78416.1 hemin ABC transporter substrate-binding protein [Erwinia tracheiphila]EOS95803.1 hemin-binding periplasmic protein [Erwinia tracheiphila PSU-1]KKF37468.1 hemin ABC transporter substrate-binding protein [Erwinia tracheiphila]UIA82852.1 hemin ABC transporter substrate-binding protein [Erwinia tracheiphila]UIA88870.1 hemin ABC transporter substrate-binding protein [Erwinia tracheiphila]